MERRGEWGARGRGLKVRRGGGLDGERREGEGGGVGGAIAGSDAATGCVAGDGGGGVEPADEVGDAALGVDVAAEAVLLGGGGCSGGEDGDRVELGEAALEGCGGEVGGAVVEHAANAGDGGLDVGLVEHFREGEDGASEALGDGVEGGAGEEVEVDEVVEVEGERCLVGIHGAKVRCWVGFVKGDGRKSGEVAK